MKNSIDSNNSNKDTLPEGAAREITSPTTARETPSSNIHKISPHQIIIDIEKLRLIEENLTDEGLAEIFGAKKEEISIGEMNGTEVMIMSYENRDQLEEVMKGNPLMKTLQHHWEKPEASNQMEWVKIRQWPIDADTEHVILLNDLLGWQGKILKPKSERKNTTALLKAPSETEARKLLDKGYIVNNGKLLAVVPQSSTQEEEEKRTVLLIGINKIHTKLCQGGGRLTEIGLLKSLVHKGYPIQSLKFAYHDENRIGHSAYVLLKQPTPAQDLQPFQDGVSGTIIKWAEITDYKEICEKCLGCSEHLQTCNKHANNVHRNINSNQIAKRAAEGGSLLLQKLKKSTPQQPPPQQRDE